jgi:hypothetical protein
LYTNRLVGLASTRIFYRSSTGEEEEEDNVPDLGEKCAVL